MGRWPKPAKRRLYASGQREAAASLRLSATDMTTSSRSTLLVQDVGEDQWRDDRGVGLDDKAGSVHGELAPGDLLVGDGPAVGAVGRGAVGDLAEVAPEPAVLVQVLLDQRHDADREV